MKKTRTDSNKGKQKSFENAMKRIPPPKQLSDSEMFYWEYITEARPLEDWTRIDLMHAWNLSKLMVILEATHESLDEEGMTLTNDRGTPVDNPAITRIDKITRLVLSTSSKLKIHAEATVGESRDMVSRSKEQRSAMQKISKTDDLIAKPTIN